jgi:ribosomal protein S18 acetylase RimI-like enzyme
MLRDRSPAVKPVDKLADDKIVLRAALPSDAARVAECVAAAYAPWIPRVGRKPWPMLQDYPAVIDAEIVIVATVESVVAGVLVLSVTDDGFLIENVAVFPAMAGRGLGRALLMRAEQEATAHGFDSIYLYTNEKMTENIALYERIGYVEYQRREEQGFRRVFLRKALAALA